MDTCYYCDARRLDLQHAGQFHKVDRSFGPFDIFTCCDCGAMGTANPPSTSRLSDFYRRYDEFRPEWYNAAANEGALAPQYRFYARRIAKSTPPHATWADIGAGHGEVANDLAATHPNGTAIDISSRPATLNPKVAYHSVDMNASGWASDLGRSFDHVYSVAVWEHVLAPKDFARECLSLVAPGGTLTLICPDYGSLARKALGRRWPYFEPGEHISVPTRAGAEKCLRAAAQGLGITPARISVKPLNVAYSVRYLFNVLRLKALASAIPPAWSAPMPTGLLVASLKRSK